MEPESPSTYPQVAATCPYPETNPSSPHDPLNILKIHLNIILATTTWSPNPDHSAITLAPINENKRKEKEII
jgi:hypothetical protein